MDIIVVVTQCAGHIFLNSSLVGKHLPSACDLRLQITIKEPLELHHFDGGGPAVPIESMFPLFYLRYGFSLVICDLGPAYNNYRKKRPWSPKLAACFRIQSKTLSIIIASEPWSPRKWLIGCLESGDLDFFMVYLCHCLRAKSINEDSVCMNPT